MTLLAVGTWQIGTVATFFRVTRFGDDVVHEMNRLGMLVDLSYVGADTMEDALRVTDAPVTFSHLSARAIRNVPRNVSDKVLPMVAQNGGGVM